MLTIIRAPNSKLGCGNHKFNVSEAKHFPELNKVDPMMLAEFKIKSGGHRDKPE